MPPKYLQIYRWGWQLTSQLIIKAEISALQIQIQKLPIEPGVVIHSIIPAFRRLKKVGYIVSPRTACTTQWNPVSETKKGKKKKPYTLQNKTIQLGQQAKNGGTSMDPLPFPGLFSTLIGAHWMRLSGQSFEFRGRQTVTASNHSSFRASQ